MKVRILTALMLSLCSLSLFADSDWKLEKDQDGVTVYTREVADSAFREFKGETTVNVELNRALALMDDTGACVEWMHSCKSPVLIRKLTPLKRYSYMVNDLPWPVKDRALLLTATITQEMPSRVVTVALETVDPAALTDADRAKIPADNGAVPIEVAKGFFRFTPLAADQAGSEKTHVEYRMHTEPSGSLPAGLVNAMLVDTPFHTLKAMQDVVTAEKYRDFKPF